MLTLFFSVDRVTDYATACKADRARFARWHRALLERGVYWPPSQLEAAFISAAHTRADVELTCARRMARFANARYVLKLDGGRGRLARVLTHRTHSFGLAAIALALLFGGCAKGNKKEPPSNAVAAPPKLEIIEKLHDFGNATEGDKLTYAFKVKNSGTGPLLIDRVTTSCGCTAAVLKNKEVLPGGEGQIEVTFDTNRRGGDNHKTITVFSNDPSNPRAELEIRANVETLLTLVPAFVRLNPELGQQQVMESWLAGKL